MSTRNPRGAHVIELLSAEVAHELARGVVVDREQHGVAFVRLRPMLSGSMKVSTALSVTKKSSTKSSRSSRTTAALRRVR